MTRIPTCRVCHRITDGSDADNLCDKCRIEEGTDLIGCEHNIHRTIKYPKSYVQNGKSRGKSPKTFKTGDVIELACSKGCEAIIITLGKECKPKRKRKE